MRKPLPAKAYLQEVFSYDPATGALVWKERPLWHFSSEHEHRRWNTRYSGKPALAHKGNEDYLTGALDKVTYQAHRIIWKMQTGLDPDFIDHINGTRHDNRWVNLRDVPWHTNLQNQKRASNNTSGVLGVSLFQGRWVARICINRKSIFLGSFENLQDAAAARKAAESQYGFHPNHGR